MYLYDPVFRRPRAWSNKELRKIAPYFTGSVINVSGWADEDKEGKTYRSYFTNATSYEISNYKGGKQIGKKRVLEDSIPLDLELQIPPELKKKYDCVFCHTVLEHIYNFQQAVENLCELSRDTIIVIVPFMQKIHINPDEYLDYWRFTPYALERLFGEKGFKVIYRSGTDYLNSSLYYLYVLSCTPEKWENILGHPKDISELPQGWSGGLFYRILYRLFLIFNFIIKKISHVF